MGDEGPFEVCAMNLFQCHQTTSPLHREIFIRLFTLVQFCSLRIFRETFRAFSAQAEFAGTPGLQRLLAGFRGEDQAGGPGHFDGGADGTRAHLASKKNFWLISLK